MSTAQANAMIQQLLTDQDFRERLEAAPVEGKRAVLAAEGYGDVKLAHLSAVLPESSGGELTDEEFAAVAGGRGTGTLIGTVTGGTALTIATGWVAGALA